MAAGGKQQLHIKGPAAMLGPPAGRGGLPYEQSPHHRARTRVLWSAAPAAQLSQGSWPPAAPPPLRVHPETKDAVAVGLSPGPTRGGGSRGVKTAPWGSEGTAVGATPKPRWQSPGPWKTGAKVHSWSPSPCHPPLSPISGPPGERGLHGLETSWLLALLQEPAWGSLQHQCGHCARG